MYTELDLFLLDAAKGYVRSLSDEQFLALTCDHSSLLAGLVRLIRNQSSARGFDSTANTARTFRLSTRQIRNILKKHDFLQKRKFISVPFVLKAVILSRLSGSPRIGKKHTAQQIVEA